VADRSRTGKIAFWTSHTGIDGKHPMDLDELDLTPIGATIARLVRRQG
jgi:hypothetical protein